MGKVAFDVEQRVFQRCELCLEPNDYERPVDVFLVVDAVEPQASGIAA